MQLIHSFIFFCFYQQPCCNVIREVFLLSFAAISKLPTESWGSLIDFSDPIPEKNPPAYNDESQGPSCPPNSQQTGYPQEPGQPTSYLQPAPGYPLKPVDGCPAESIKTYVPPPPGYSHSQNQGYVQQPGTNHVGCNFKRVVVTVSKMDDWIDWKRVGRRGRKKEGRKERRKEGRKEGANGRVIRIKLNINCEITGVKNLIPATVNRNCCSYASFQWQYGTILIFLPLLLLDSRGICHCEIFRGNNNLNPNPNPDLNYIRNYKIYNNYHNKIRSCCS